MAILKYFRVREQAESEAKKHIDKLNKLMERRLTKEKKFKENAQEMNQYRLQIISKLELRRSAARERVSKHLNDLEN